MQFFLDLQNLHAAGLRVAIHPPGIMSNMKEGTCMITESGMETTITLTQTQLIRQPAPYSNYMMKLMLGAPGVDALNPTVYMQDYCFNACIQRQYIKTCGCIQVSHQDTRLAHANTMILYINLMYYCYQVPNITNHTFIAIFDTRHIIE